MMNNEIEDGEANIYVAGGDFLYYHSPSILWKSEYFFGNSYTSYEWDGK
jgi:hypothetical protein